MSLELPICVLFNSLMQSVNGAEFLNTTYLSLLPPPAGTAATVTFLLASIYALL